jgi:hypothetical protein
MVSKPLCVYVAEAEGINNFLFEALLNSQDFFAFFIGKDL